jgi:hypothetical protein
MKERSRLFLYAIPVIIVLAGLTVYQYGVVNARREMVSLRETGAARERVLAKCMEVIAGRPELEKRLVVLKEKRKAAMSKIIEAQTLTLCAAALQETVKGIITGRGGSIISERVEKAEEFGKLRVVTIAVDAALPDTRAVSDILFGIETHEPYNVVREMDTRGRHFREHRALMVKLCLSALRGGK